MVRAAMGLEETVQAAPKQLSLEELSAKRAQVEKRHEDMAKRIVDTQKKLESFTKKLEELSMYDHGRACTAGRRPPTT